MGGFEGLADYNEQLRYAASLWAEGLLKRVTYKEGWKIKVSFTGMVQIITPPWSDVTGNGKPIMGMTQFDPVLLFQSRDPHTEEYFYLEVWRSVRDLEDHEMKEWFRVDKKALFLTEQDERKFHHGQI